MKAVRLHKAGDLRVEEVAAPGAVAEGWVHLTVTAAGICGSDLHNFRTGQWITRAPSIAGHELTGIVTDVHPSVEGLKVGDHVVADSRFWCGECPACRADRQHLCVRLGFIGEACDGGFAEEVVLPVRLLLKVAHEIDPAVAAMAEPLAVALHAVRRLAPRPGQPVLVVGCGPIGGLAALVLARQHDGPLLLAERNAVRLELVSDVTGGRPVALDAEAIRAALRDASAPLAAIEATGNVGALTQLVEAMPAGGSLALVGIYHGGLPLDPNLLVEREIALIGCHAFADELPEAVTLLGSLASDLARLIDREISLDEVPAAYSRLIAGEATGLKTHRPAMTRTSRTAEIRALAATDAPAAERRLAALLHDLFGLQATSVRINLDRYSLNSLNGFIDSAEGAFFFKFHQEEGEEAMAGEYYRADILARAGLPVDQPLHVSSEPGEQILIYRRRNQPRFSDVLRELDLADDTAQRERAVAAERSLGNRLAAVYRDTLHEVSPADVAAEPIHRLFHERLVERHTGRFPGGRLADFYVGKRFRFPGVELAWEEFAGLSFVINGRAYERTLGELFNRAYARLAPARLADSGGVVAHGDAHNANVWYEERTEGAALSLFDPAFAGMSVPALLAEVKATFHNIFAHPFWLYDPALATERFDATTRREGNALVVETDWALSAVRQGLLAAKAETVWRPLLAELQRRGWLPDDWREVLRLALFLCPTLVMNLRAGAATHTPISSLIGFSVAVMVGSPPRDGADIVTRFLDAIDPAIPERGQEDVSQ